MKGNYPQSACYIFKYGFIFLNASVLAEIATQFFLVSKLLAFANVLLARRRENLGFTNAN
jgi:hypothetical protein